MADTKTANKGSLDELITTLVRRAPELHAAGVTSIAHGDFAATLVPTPAGAAGDDAEQPREARRPSNPLQDNATFPSGRGRGFARPGRM